MVIKSRAIKTADELEALPEGTPLTCLCGYKAMRATGSGILFTTGVRISIDTAIAYHHEWFTDVPELVSAQQLRVAQNAVAMYLGSCEPDLVFGGRAASTCVSHDSPWVEVNGMCLEMSSAMKAAKRSLEVGESA